MNFEYICDKLELSQEQREIMREIAKKESALRGSLVRCGVYHKAIDKIVNKADFDKLPSDDAILDNMVQETWGAFITRKGE